MTRGIKSNEFTFGSWDVSWTGWKGTKGYATNEYIKTDCCVCGGNFIKDQPVYRTQGAPIVHWTCKYPDNRPDRLVGQWVAYHYNIKDYAYYVNVGGPDTACGKFKRGDCFDIGEEAIVTERTGVKVKNSLVDEGREKIKQLLKEYECIATK